MKLSRRKYHQIKLLLIVYIALIFLSTKTMDDIIDRLMEPVLGGILVSLINRYIISKINLFTCCEYCTVNDEYDYEVDNSAENSAIYSHHVVIPHT
jgi:hypothetical protein